MIFKKISLSVLLLFLACNCFSQEIQKLPIDTVTKNITYQEVVYVDGINKNQLYTRAKEWFVKTFVSAKEVIQLDDKEVGKIIGKGSSNTSYTYLGVFVSVNIDYTISITLKDNKYRYEITSFKANWPANSASAEELLNIVEKKKSGQAVAKRVISLIDKKGVELANSIKQFLASNGNSKDEF